MELPAQVHSKQLNSELQSMAHNHGIGPLAQDFGIRVLFPVHKYKTQLLILHQGNLKLSLIL